MDRDAIAVLAMQGMLAHARPYKAIGPMHWHDCLAKEAYQIATAMLRARDADQKAREKALNVALGTNEAGLYGDGRDGL